MNDKLNIDYKKLDEWNDNDDEIVTSIVRELAWYLFPRPEVTILDKDTAGDQYFKVDIILDFPEYTITADKSENIPETKYLSRTIAFQCKTQQEAAERFVEKYKDGVKYKGQTYPCPGVYYNNAQNINECFTMEQLENLAEFTHSIVNPEFIKAIELLESLKRIAERDRLYTYLDQRRFHNLFDSSIWDSLERFNYVTKGGGRIIYKF